MGQEERGSGRAPGPEPCAPWRVPGQFSTPQSPASSPGSPRPPNSLPWRLGLRAGVRRMSPGSGCCCRPSAYCSQAQSRGAARRGARASVDCELKPQVRRVRCGRAASWHLSGGYLLNPTKRRTLGPQADSSGGAPLSFHRGAFLLERTAAPSVPLSRGAALWPPKTLSLSARGSPAQGSPGGVSWVSPARVGGIQGTNPREQCGAETWAHLLWNFVPSSLP